MDTFTFVDKYTGDVIQTGAPNDFSLNASQTRAIADFHAPVSIFHSFEPSLREESFGFEYAAVEPTGLKSDVKPAFEIEIETVSPCAKKPRVVAPTHFYVDHPRYTVLKEDIDRSLRERCELVFSACPKKQMWKCKYLEGSQTREMHVQCFWDQNKKSHLVEVKRVHGDGIFPQYTDLVTVLKQGLGIAAPSSSSVRRPGPPPMMRGGTAPPVVGAAVERSPEQFRETLQVIVDMSKHAYNEPRLEASKMLCDIIEKQPLALLESENVQAELLEMVNSFLQDQHEVVNEFGVVATHALLSKSMLYRRLMVQYKMGSILGSLIAHIRNPEYDEETGESDFYLYAQMRRLAGKALSMLVKDCCGACVSTVPRREFLSRVLQQSGFFTVEDWREYTLRLQDDVLRTTVMSVGDCYC